MPGISAYVDRVAAQARLFLIWMIFTEYALSCEKKSIRCSERAEIFGERERERDKSKQQALPLIHSTPTGYYKADLLLASRQLLLWKEAAA